MKYDICRTATAGMTNNVRTHAKKQFTKCLVTNDVGHLDPRLTVSLMAIFVSFS